MLMKAGMALEPCQYDHSADDEPRRGRLLSESDSDMEDARGSTSTAESTELPPIDRDSEEIRAAPQRAPRLGELSRDSMMDGSQLEFFDASDHFFDSTDCGGTAAPTIESNDRITPVNNSVSFNGSSSCDCKPIECGESQEEPPNSVHCKDFINNPCSAAISGSLHITTECKEIIRQLHSITESGNNDHPHSTTESKDPHNTTDSTEMSDQTHSATQSENNSDQLHRTTESEEICDEVQTGMALETVHQPHYITDSSDGSEKPNNTIECEDICVHSFAESKQVSDQTRSTTKSAETSPQANNAKLTEGVVDQHKTTEAKDMNDQIDTNGEPEVMCDQKLDLESDIIGSKCNHTAELETTEKSIKIVALEEIFYLPQNTSESENISVDPHSTTGGKEDSTQLDNREFEIGEQMHRTTESKETSREQTTAQNNTTREAVEVSEQMNNSTKCKEVIVQIHNLTKSEVRDELGNNTKCEVTKDFTQITGESQEISVRATELAQISHKSQHTTKPEDFCGQSLYVVEPDGIIDQVQSSTAESQASDRLHRTTKSEDTVGQSDSATEPAHSADQSSNSPYSANSSNQTCKAKGSKEDCDRPQDSMEVTDHSNTLHLSTVSAKHDDQLNSTYYPTDGPSDLSIAITSKDFKEVPDKSELGESIRGSPSNVQSSKMEAVCQSDGFTTQSVDSQPKNVNMEFCTILPTCINSQEDIGHERSEPIASDVIHPQDIVFTDIHIVNEEDSEPCYNERGIQASEDQLPTDAVPSESPKESHQSDTSLETNDGSSGNSAFPETHSELHNATELAETCQGITIDQDRESVIEVEHFVPESTTPLLEVTHPLDSIYHPWSDAEGLQVEGKVVSHKDPHITNNYDIGPVGTGMHHGLPSEDMDVQEIGEMFSEWAPSTGDNPVCTDSLEPNSRISVDEDSELAVMLPSSSHELLDACPLNLVPYKQTVDDDQTEQSGVVELETVVQTVDQTQNPGSPPQIPSATFSSALIGQKSTHCETNEEVAKMLESITEEHGSQNKHQSLTSADSEPHSESLTTSDFDGRLQPDSELVPVEGAALKQDVHDQKFDPSDEAKNDLACNMPDGQQDDHHRGNSELEPKLCRLVHQTSSTEGQQAPFYFTEDWKEVLQPPNQKVYFRLKQEVGIDRDPSVDSKEKFTVAPENNSKSEQWFVEPHCQESREDTHETDGVAVGVNQVKINTEFMKFLGHMPKFFGEADKDFCELPSETSKGLDEFESEAYRTSDVNSSTSVGHGNQQDSLVLDSSVNLEGINIPPTSKPATPIHFFNPLVELSPEESEAFFKRDIVADLQDDATIIASPETLPANDLNTSLPSHTPIPHTVSVNAYDPCSDTKPRSRSLLVTDISSMPDYSPSTENVFHSPQPSPVTVIAGTAENEPESRSSWMPTWKVPDDSVMQLLSKKLLSPKLARSGSKIYKTTGGIAGMNKDSQNRHSMPVLVSHSQLTDQCVQGVSESRELSKTPTKIPKSFHAARAPTQSKAMFRHVALPEVSEEAPRCDQEDPHQVGENKSEDEPHDEDMDWTASDPVLLRDKNFANQTGNIMRRRSKLIDSSRLLYQEYSDVALNQAIERQKRTETFLEESEPSSPRLRRKLLSSPDSYLQRLSVSSSASLWQDIPMIRGTSTLLSMTREEQKLQEAKFELIMSEASYLRSLNIAVDHFQHSPELQTLLSNQARQWLFSRLQEVRDVSSEFLFDLEEKFEDNMYTFNVCDVVLSHAPAIRKVYLPYVTNQSYQDQTFRQLLGGNPRFQQVLGKLESDPVCQRLSLKSFLILPFQRITRLKLLVQNVLKRTRLGSREEAQATQAYNLMEKLIKDCNENVQRMRSTEELIYLSQKIEFECKIFPLISQSRRLVKQGELTELEYGSPLSFKWKVITRPVYLHLFNDCLLLSRRREGSRFVVFDHARASKVRGEKCEIKLHGTNKNIFRLTLQENNQGRRVEFLLRTDTQSEKLRWISALAPPRKKPDLMECHDNPQVQCLKSYKARENDELSLEKADIIMVTQQSKEGWIEGIRLSDGEHGWFPVENVEDISNRHVRLRNLKEEHRVQCARAKLMPLSHR